MNAFGDTLAKFYSCDGLVLGGLVYVGHRFVPGPEALSGLLSFIPGFSNQVSVGSAVIVALVANVISMKVAEQVCGMPSS
jgi:hypothetical protein